MYPLSYPVASSLPPHLLLDGVQTLIHEDLHLQASVVHPQSAAVLHRPTTVDLRGILIHTVQEVYLDPVRRDDTELAQGQFPRDPDPRLEDEVVEEIALDVTVVEEGGVQAIVATAVMMIEAEAEVVVEEDEDGVKNYHKESFSAMEFGPWKGVLLVLESLLKIEAVGPAWCTDVAMQIANLYRGRRNRTR